MRIFIQAILEGNHCDDRVMVCGRILKIRDMSKSIFARIGDETGEMQIYIDKSKNILEGLKRNDLVTLYGTIGRTKTGELSIFCDASSTICVHPDEQVPEIILDEEFILENRYLQLISDREVFFRLRKKYEVITSLKIKLSELGFLEVSTPILLKGVFAGTSREFSTLSNGLGRDLYLRGTCEYSLKQLIIAGYDRIFEFGPVFRNESPSLIEFPLLEIQESFGNMSGMIAKLTPILKSILRDFADKLDTKEYSNIQWKQQAFYEVVSAYLNIDYLGLDNNDIEVLANRLGIHLQDGPYKKVLLAHKIFKKEIVPTLREPIFVINYPKELSPLAKKDNMDTNNTAERAYLFINGYRIGEFVTEENNPESQEKSIGLQEELSHKAKSGNKINLIKPLQFGMPPTGGVGININRLFASIINSPSLLDISIFPHSASKIHN